MTMASKMKKSTSNVFRDLGFRADDAEHLRIRALLMAEIAKVIRTRRLSQRSAAELLGVSQPRVSDLVRGRIDLFSIDALVDMLARAGKAVRLTISTARTRFRVA